jgi:hypothetical protein
MLMYFSLFFRNPWDSPSQVINYSPEDYAIQQDSVHYFIAGNYEL